jgi:hypothetical protein
MSCPVHFGLWWSFREPPMIFLSRGFRAQPPAGSLGRTDWKHSTQQAPLFHNSYRDANNRLKRRWVFKLPSLCAGRHHNDGTLASWWDRLRSASLLLLPGWLSDWETTPCLSRGPSTQASKGPPRSTAPGACQCHAARPHPHPTPQRLPSKARHSNLQVQDWADNKTAPRREGSTRSGRVLLVYACYI